MKSTLIIIIQLASILGLSAVSNPPYNMNINVNNGSYIFESFPKTYQIVGESVVDSSSEVYSGHSNDGSGKNPYYIDENKTYYLELRDSTNKVIWSREMLKEHTGSASANDEYNNQENSTNNNPEATLVRCVYLEEDGTTLLADKDNKRYYLLDKLGKRTNLPFGTLGMTSGGWVANRYWLLSHGVGIQNLPMSEYDSQTEDESLDSFYASYVTLYNKDGSLYKFIDLSEWGGSTNFQIDPTASYCWFTWSRQVPFNPTSGIRDDDQNNPVFGDQVPGMTIMELDGKIIYTGVVTSDNIQQNQYRESIYASGWNVNGDLLYLISDNMVRVLETSTGKTYAKMATQSPSGESYHCNIEGLSDKKAGLAFISAYSYLVVKDYINDKIVAVIPQLGYPYHLQLQKQDGSEFTIWTENIKTTYSLH